LKARNLLLLLISATYACTSGSSTGEPAADPVPSRAEADSARVELGPNSPQLERLSIETVLRARVPLDVVVAPGRIEGNPNRISRVLMPVPGRVREVFASVGQAVKAGQPLLTIESPEASAALSALNQAEAARSEARAAVAKAEADFDRIRDLVEHRAVALKEQVAAEAALAQARADLERAESGVMEATRRIEILGLRPGGFDQQITVSAPLPGKVLEVAVAPGEYRNDTGTPLMVIADLSTVYMTSAVPESQIRLVHLGEQVEVRLDAFPDEVFRARVALIADVVESRTRTIEVRAELRNPLGRFRPEMFGRMVHEESFADVVVAPSEAIIQDAAGSFVVREIANGLFEPVLVRTGRPGAAGIPILEGLSEGDRIVTRGAALVFRQPS